MVFGDAVFPMKRLLLGISGGIAAYKSGELVRRLKDAQWSVRVVMTRAATEFVTPLTFQALSGLPVHTTLLDPHAEAAMGHIELARWPDAILIAPASADVIARLAHGLADDLLTTVCLATDKPLMVAPAMNRLMWQHPATQDNVARLRRRGVQIWGPGSGAQACGEVGDGRLLEPLELRDRLLAWANQADATDTALAGESVVITAGPTREPLDPVRFLSNRSSGKMGFALAHAAAVRGARVTLISGPVALDTPAGVTRVDVETALDMDAAVHATQGHCTIFIGCAAVADYRAAQIADHKIKKTDQTDDRLTLSLVRNPDIIARVAAWSPKPFTVGFAAETRELAHYAAQKRQQKGLDLIAANWVGDRQGFEMDDNTLYLVSADGEQTLGPAPKTHLAHDLMTRIAHQRSRRSPPTPSASAT